MKKRRKSLSLHLALQLSLSDLTLTEGSFHSVHVEEIILNIFTTATATVTYCFLQPSETDNKDLTEASD